MPYTVIVVEDDKHINEVVSEYMKEAGFIVISFDNGKSAYEAMLQNEQIHLFILDIMLPEMTGLMLLNTIRLQERFRETPVIMLTALNDEYTQLMSFDSLADDYVTKPFSPKVLVKRAQALIRRTGHTPDVLTIGGITVDFESYEAFENGDKIKLTLREFELLTVFIKHQKKVYTRQQLLNLVWGYDFFGDERIVDVHIKNVRKKFKTNIITTVKGVGYKSDIGGDSSC